MAISISHSSLYYLHKRHIYFYLLQYDESSVNLSVVVKTNAIQRSADKKLNDYFDKYILELGSW